MAQAQAQAQRTISKTESLELSVFHVSAMRGLFDDSFFKDVVMKNLDGMTIKVLTPKDDESKRLVDWIEGGVYDAIKKGYLKSLLFGISNNMEGTDLLEEYVYNFTYGKDGAAAMDIQANIKQKGKKGGKVSGSVSAKPATFSGVRYQVTRLMRMLVTLCRSLDRVPAVRYLFCRLVYHDHTPDEYEPQYFRSVDANDLGHFSRKPFTMQVGQIATEHHQVGLRLKSILDSCDDAGEGDMDAEQEQMASGGASDEERELPGDEQGGGKDQCNQKAVLATDAAYTATGKDGTTATCVDVTTHGPDPAAHTALKNIPPKERAAADLDDLMTEHQPHYSPPAPLVDADTTVAMHDGNMSADETECPHEDPDAAFYQSVKNFCMRQTLVDVEDLMAQFMSLSSSSASAYLQRLCKEGLLQPSGRRGAYRVVTQDARNEVAARDQGKALASRMDGLAVGDRKVAAAARSKASDMGGIQTNQAGSDITQSPSAGSNGNNQPRQKGKRGLSAGSDAADGEMADAAAEPHVHSQAPPMVYYDASQHSNRKAAKQRKISYVMEPIHQVGPKSKAAASSSMGNRSTSRLRRMRR